MDIITFISNVTDFSAMYIFNIINPWVCFLLSSNFEEEIVVNPQEPCICFVCSSSQCKLLLSVRDEQSTELPINWKFLHDFLENDGLTINKRKLVAACYLYFIGQK